MSDVDEVDAVYERYAHRLLVGDVLRQCDGIYTAGTLDLENRSIRFEVDKTDDVWILTITDKVNDNSQTINVIPAYTGKSGPRRYAV